MTSEAPPSTPLLPEPLRRSTQTRIDVGDRIVTVLAQSEEPRFVVLGNVLSDEECDALIALARPKMDVARVVDPTTGQLEGHEARTSEGTYFLVEENPFVAAIDRRLARLLQWPIENGEGLQILHYRPGGEYLPHFDFFDPSVPGATDAGGNRVATLIIYLQVPDEGGATRFSDIGFEVMPQKGAALFFSYDRPSPDTLTLHAGLPVIEGEKWIATRWMRERAYRTD